MLHCGASINLSEPDICIPVAEAVVVRRLFLGEHKVGEAKHGGHIFFAAEIVAGDSDQVARIPFSVPQTDQNQIAEAVIAMQ